MPIALHLPSLEKNWGPQNFQYLFVIPLGFPAKAKGRKYTGGSLSPDAQKSKTNEEHGQDELARMGRTGF
jgi:hypothetical protein